MKPSFKPFRHRPGATLVEAVIAMGVLAVAVPLVMGAIAEAGKSSMASEAETCSIWMIPACMEEIRASRDGCPRYFTAIATGQPFPAAGDFWALAFSPEGKPVGKLSKALHNSGAKELHGKPIRFIAVISADARPLLPGATPMLNARISIQYPAAAPVAKRGQFDFHTLIP